jgi:heat shock protein HslJ
MVGMTDETVPDQAESEFPENPQTPHNPLLVCVTVALMVILVALIIFVAISGTQVSAPTVLMHTKWTLQFYANQTDVLVPALAGVTVTAGFGTNNLVTGSSGCNYYFANYTIQHYALEISQPVVTELLCPGPGIMQQESIFLSDLPKSYEYRINSTDLEVYDARGMPVFVFIPARPKSFGEV